MAAAEAETSEMITARRRGFFCAIQFDPRIQQLGWSPSCAVILSGG